MSYANRGMGFEAIIDMSNEMYDRKGIAVINKRPTPVKILGRNSKGMVHGFLEKASTVDYDGVYRSKPIYFEAKSTNELRRFDLKNVQEHQAKHLKKVDKHGGVAFILVEFVAHRTVYLLSYETFEHYWSKAQRGGRKSIPIADFDLYAYPVHEGRVPVDYLKTVDKVWRLTV